MLKVVLGMDDRPCVLIIPLITIFDEYIVVAVVAVVNSGVFKVEYAEAVVFNEMLDTDRVG